jgi:RNA polymerase sigma factor (sigma-70 family)
MLASFDEAEDAVQETFLRAWRNRERFEGDAHFRAWLYRIATNVCLDMIRRRSRRNRMPTAASYLRRPGDSKFRAFKFDVLRVENGAVAEITTFGTTLFPAFGQPSAL